MAAAQLSKDSGTSLGRELIDDRALESFDQDRFGHADFVEELALLATSVQTPSNIALFGAWGSGKTGLANLLRQRLEEEKGVQVAMFDAFKYAEAPLRRQFLSQLALELGIANEEFREDLYRTTVSNKVKIPTIDLLKLLGIFLLSMFAVEALITVAVVITAAITDQAVSTVLGRFFDAGLLLAVAPASFLTILAGLAGKVLTLERTASAPSSEEEFERLFRRIVSESKAKRIVVVVDELDRCSPKEVVSTLETIKTFLDVRKCVFVVAADQQVLEQSLTRSVRQTTPADTTNPYYSAGSAYIDKIFQYQLSLPPLLARRLSGFALDLVQHKGGFWDTLNREVVVSTLVPDHVSSPRRVKTLLNGFVMAYRLALRRAEEGGIAGPLPERAPELAKLVCMRLEFPLFANDLRLDWRLPLFVQMLAEDPEAQLPGHVAAAVQERARLYSARQLPVDELLIEEEDTEAAENEAEGEDEGRPPSEPSVQSVHGEQLVRYLQKTAYIEGPRRDLIHLESSGTLFGLDPALADALEDQATSGQAARVVSTVAELDIDQQASAIKLLAQRTRESSIGVESSNAVTALLQAFGGMENEIVDQVVDHVAEAVNTVQAKFSLRPEDVKGTYLVAIRSSRPVASNLLEATLQRDEVLDDPQLGLLVIGTAEGVPKRYLSRLSQVFSARLMDPETSEDVASALSGVEDDVASSIIESARSAVTELANSRIASGA